jgi:adenine-specific DNA-methyltransferase
MKKALPITRYYGSKRKIVNDIWEIIQNEQLEFDSVLDLFGGTGTFAYKAKLKGKQVIYNDIFKFNSLIGKALIQNNSTKLTQNDIAFLTIKHVDLSYKYHIQEHYHDIYFLDHENELIDIITQNIAYLDSNYKKAMAFYALFQTLLIKRPFNSFHRKNLLLRTRDVKRSFGNKVTWEKDLVQTFQTFCLDINQYVFSNNKNNKSINTSALRCKATADIIYIDPPYISEKGHHVNYHSRYHFLEALVNYENFTDFISLEKQNKEVLINNSPEFENKQMMHADIDKLISKYRDKTIIFSYRNHGIPSPEELKEIFLTYKKSCKEFILDQHYYALNRSNHKLHELIYILE